MAVHVANHRLQGAVDHFGVRVQQQKIATFGAGQTLVVGGREAQVPLVGDQANVGKLVTNHARAAIVTCIVHDEDFRLESGGRGGIGDGSQTPAEQVADVPTYDDNSQIDHTSPAAPGAS